MNYFDPYPLHPGQNILAAWDSQVKEADRTPWLADTLTECGGELFSRFAACYAELRALPRSARRALQRRIARSRELAAIFPECLQSGGGRALQHKLARSLAGAALLLALGQGIVEAATINVATNNPRIKSDGQCSLIEAIVNANNDAATHADCPAGSGPDIIVLPANAKVTLRAEYVSTYYPNGLPLITSPVTIEGNNAKIVRSAVASPFGLLAVSNTGDLTLQNVTLSGAYDGSGGVSNFGGTLTIQNSTISGNKVGGNGGGVSNNGSWVHITNSTISNNALKIGPYCFYYYGVNCYYLYPGRVTIANSTISGNSAQWRGGGVANHAGTVTIENSTISGNKGGWAGGVYNTGGGFFDYYGKYIPAGSLSIANSTISKNSAYDGAGGGVLNYGKLTLNRSLVSGNMAARDREIKNTAAVTADNFNLFGANGKAGVNGFTPGLTDIVPARGVRVGKILDRLKDNGGPTRTHALKPGSPAVDVIPFTDPDCAGKDQRGVDRPQGTGCDIGAFERDGP